MKNTRYRAALHTLILLIAMTLGTAAAQPGAPMQAVERLHSTLLEAARNGEALGYDGRYELLEPVIRNTHDIAFIGQLTTGRYWRQMDDAERQTFSEAFLRLSTATYASRFKSLSGEGFELLSESEQGPDSALVESLLSLADGKTLRFDYALRKSNDNWLIVNILVDGVSDLALKRAEYRRILKQGGFTALIDHLMEQVSELETA